MLKSKKIINIDFVDFWNGFSKKDNFIYNRLIENYNVIISDKPDYIFFSVFGIENLKYKCKKIFYTGENIKPDFSNCDYAISFDFLDNENHLRLSTPAILPGYYDLLNKNINNDLCKRKFCNFIVSNGANKIRNDFFLKLSKYKKVDSGGMVLNNISYLVSDKLSFQSNYKFSLTFENNAHRETRFGYTTEKIFDAMKANSLPIYWGNDWIERDFNTKSFINYNDFKNEDEIIDYIVYLDSNDDKYLEKLREPWFVNNEIPMHSKKEVFYNFLNKIFN